MPIKQYGVVKGRVTEARTERDDTKSPHYQIKVVAGADGNFRVPVNVQSNDGSMVRYLVDEDFDHPVVDKLGALADGHHPVASEPGGLALDYVRGALFEPGAMVTLPSHEEGEDNDLHDLLDHLVIPVKNDPAGVVYAWGERWTNTSFKLPIDEAFGALSGVHDIHMNQGNPPKPKRFFEDNGVWQDGGLVLHSPKARTWKAIFFAFKSQTFDTDAKGNPLGAKPDDEVIHDRLRGGIHIVAAMVNPAGNGAESVSILNGTDATLAINGWSIVDKEGRRQRLRGTIAAGKLKTVKLSKNGVILANSGGTIAIEDEGGQVLDAVRYSRADAKHKGSSVVF